MDIEQCLLKLCVLQIRKKLSILLQQVVLLTYSPHVCMRFLQESLYLPKP